MRRSLVIDDFAPDHSEFPNIWGKFSFLFYQCTSAPSASCCREDVQKTTFVAVWICWSDPCFPSGLCASLTHIGLWEQENRGGNIVNIEYQSFCPFVRIGSPTPCQANECGPPRTQVGGRHTRLRGRGGTQFRRRDRNSVYYNPFTGRI
jgi:hypothetical protein